MAVRTRIEGIGLPGAAYEGGGHPDVHVGVQRRGRGDDLLGLVHGDAPSATWTLDCTADRGEDGVDLRGPYAQGPRRGRFIYLSWVNVGEGGQPTMLRRAKPMLDALPPETAAAAIDGGELVTRVGSTDERGGPLFAAVRPPRITWTVETA